MNDAFTDCFLETDLLSTDAMRGYNYQVFVSYRRQGDWTAWVTRLFVQKLKTFLAAELPGQIRVFSDEQIQTGAGWEVAINQAIDTSCIMVPVFMNNYFSSEWCRRELARMLHREKELGFRTQDCNKRLILPVRISGRRYFPDLALAIQDKDLCRFALPHMAETTEVHQHFDQTMAEFCRTLADAVADVPDHDSAWSALDGAPFLAQLEPKPFRLIINPRLGA